MSAYVVSETHINTLLTWANRARVSALRTGTQTPALSFDQVDDLQKMAQLLMDQNARSVNYRYSEMEPAPEIVFHFVKCPLPIDIIKLCNGYRYQACETPDYEQTTASAIINRIREHAICKIPGYDAAPWSL